MAKSSMHIQGSVRGSIGHNSRENFSYSVVFKDEKNECDIMKSEAYKVYRSELKKRSEAYTKRTGQKLQNSTVTQLSAIVNLEQHHTLKDLEPIKAELEREFGTKVFQMVIHRDEGKLISKKDGTEFYSGKDFFLNHEDNKLYLDKQFTKEVDMGMYDIQKNYHAHFEMMGLDNNGNAIRQKMNTRTLKRLQTFTADTLNMERGKETTSYTKEQMREIVAIVGEKTDYASTKLYAQRFNEVAKELGYFIKKRKRQDTHKFKDIGAERENAKREQLAQQNRQEDNKNATQKDLKEEIFNLHQKLKQANAVREDYAKLEDLNRTLKQQVKDKDLTIGELKKQIDLFKEMIDTKDEEISILKDTNATLEQENKESKSNIEQSLKKIENLEDENRILKEEISTLYQENRTLKKFANAVKKIISEKLTNSPIHNLEDVLRKIKEYFNIKDTEPVYEVEQKEDAEHVKLALLHEELSNIETHHRGDAKSVACFIQDAYSDGYTSLKELKNGDMCIVNEETEQKYNLRDKKYAEYAELYIKAQSKLDEMYNKTEGSSSEAKNEDTKTKDQTKSKVRKSR